MSDYLNDLAIIVFAREPKLGKVKTRLQDKLSAENVLKLYKAFLRDVLSIVKKFSNGHLFIYYYGSGHSIPFLRSCGPELKLKRQTSGDLGVKMGKAFRNCFAQKFRKVLIIGADCVTISENDIQKASKLLDDNDCVLGPSKDGGYYLIGLKDFHSQYFRNVRWGGTKVLEQTVNNFKRLNKVIGFLRIQNDIDTLEDLRNFSQTSHKKNIAQHTQKAIVSLGIFNHRGI